MPASFFLPVLKSIAIGSSAVVSGTYLSTSLISVPALLVAPPPVLARQWSLVYSLGLPPIVGLSLSSAAAYAYLAYDAVQTGQHEKFWFSFAAVAAVGFAPYTRIVLGGINEKLGALGEKAGAATDGAGAGKSGVGDSASGLNEKEKGEVHQLVRKWGRLNLVRAIFPLAATVAGLWAVVF